MIGPCLPLTDLQACRVGYIREFNLTENHMRRIAPMGLSKGCLVRIVRNSGRRALIIKAMHTYLAISRTVAQNILVEVAP